MSSRVFFHVDMDAFFASVEQADHPEYRGKPVIVGAMPGKRGVVSTCSYEARAFGVRSAMPISEAARKCPHAIFLPVRMARYQEISDRVMEEFGRFTPDVEQVSVDEAFLDMTGTERLWGPPEETALRLKAAVRDSLGLSLSIGMAPNRYLAKLASARVKPDGLTIVRPGDEESFLDSIPIAKLWGAGDKTQARFRELGVDSVAALRRFREETMRSLFGKAMGSFLFQAVRGLDPGIYSAEPKSRSISSETTFERDLSDEEAILSVLRELSEAVAWKLYTSGEGARTVGVKIRYADFTTVQAQESGGRSCLSSDEIFDAARSLLAKKRDRSKAVRLLGVSVSNVDERSAFGQGDLFGDAYERKRKVEQAVFRLREQGKGKVIRAGHLKGEGEGE